jgi:hypothetical protein
MIAVIHYTAIAKGIFFAVILLTFKGAYPQICLLVIFTVFPLGTQNMNSRF